MMEKKKKSKFLKIGALWQKGEFMSGVLELPDMPKIKISIIENRFKAPNSKQPDYVISQVEEEDEATTSTEDANGIDYGY